MYTCNRTNTKSAIINSKIVVRRTAESGINNKTNEHVSDKRNQNSDSVAPKKWNRNPALEKARLDRNKKKRKRQQQKSYAQKRDKRLAKKKIMPRNARKDCKE